MKIKTATLTGAALDYAVGFANGWVTYPSDSVEQGDWFHTDKEKAPFGTCVHVDSWTPSTDWAQGGPIIEQEEISVGCIDVSGPWMAMPVKGKNKDAIFGPTPLIAAMRCYVFSKLGDEVEVPDELG